MRHGDKVNNLGRKTAHRHALLRNLTCQLIEHKQIFTTLAKAKALRVFAEPIITRSKKDSMNNRREVFSKLQDKEAVKELFGAISDKVADRPGGYTRIIKIQPRVGDAAEMALIELVDFNEIYKKEAENTQAKRTRRGRGGSGTVSKTATLTANTPTEVPTAPPTTTPEATQETIPEAVTETPTPAPVEVPSTPTEVPPIAPTEAPAHPGAEAPKEDPQATEEATPEATTHAQEQGPEDAAK